MIGRQKRLKEVYEHLRKYYGIHTQSDFAHELGYSRPFISSALNGNEDYLTDKLFKTICEAYRDVFNLDYLLTGNGYLLTVREEVTNERLEKEVNGPSEIDQSSLVNALLAANNQTIESLKRELASEKESHEREVAQMEARIEEQADHIQTLKGRLMEYRKIIDAAKIEIGNYPFPMGVAEDHQYKTK